MSYQHVKIPEGGKKVTVENGKLVVPDNPIIGYVEGDGIGPDITNASLRVWNAAVEKDVMIEGSTKLLYKEFSSKLI